MSNELVLYWAAGIITVGGAFSILWKLFSPLIRKTRALLVALEKFTRDWAGEPAEAGRDAIPGVMERLNRIDGELKHNGGSSMKDSLRRLEKTQDRLIETQNKIIDRLEEGNRRFEEIEKRLDK